MGRGGPGCRAGCVEGHAGDFRAVAEDAHDQGARGRRVHQPGEALAVTEGQAYRRGEDAGMQQVILGEGAVCKEVFLAGEATREAGTHQHLDLVFRHAAATRRRIRNQVLLDQVVHGVDVGGGTPVNRVIAGLVRDARPRGAEVCQRRVDHYLYLLRSQAATRRRVCNQVVLHDLDDISLRQDCRLVRDARPVNANREPVEVVRDRLLKLGVSDAEVGLALDVVPADCRFLYIRHAAILVHREGGNLDAG